MPRPQLPPETTDTSFGARNIRYRLKENLTRKELAESLQSIALISQNAIRSWENEGRLPRDPRHYVEMVSRFERSGV